VRSFNLNFCAHIGQNSKYSSEGICCCCAVVSLSLHFWYQTTSDRWCISRCLGMNGICSKRINEEVQSLRKLFSILSLWMIRWRTKHRRFVLKLHGFVLKLLSSTAVLTAALTTLLQMQMLRCMSSNHHCTLIRSGHYVVMNACRHKIHK
jgi:hypothetical protein